MAGYQRKYKARLTAEGKWAEAENCKKYRARLNRKMEMAEKTEKEQMILVVKKEPGAKRKEASSAREASVTEDKFSDHIDHFLGLLAKYNL